MSKAADDHGQGSDVLELPPWAWWPAVLLRRCINRDQVANLCMQSGPRNLPRNALPCYPHKNLLLHTCHTGSTNWLLHTVTRMSHTHTHNTRTHSDPQDMMHCMHNTWQYFGLGPHNTRTQTTQEHSTSMQFERVPLFPLLQRHTIVPKHFCSLSR